MKGLMLSGKDKNLLFDHLLDGFEASNNGIKNLKQSGLVKDDEYTELLEKNAQRLIDRIKEFKIAQKLVSISFAGMFLWLQISDQDLEMRRAKRMRVKRRNESEIIITT